MTTRVLTGSKQEIARKVADLEGDVRQAIVFIEEPGTTPAAGTPLPVPATVEEMFAEMEPYMSQAVDVDDSREAIYERQEGE
jgi:hypothetical protein